MIQRISVFTGWLVLAFVVYATLSPVGARPVLALPHLEHFAAFALMGLAFALAYPNRVLLVVALVVGTAAGLEALQLLTPDRHGRAARHSAGSAESVLARHCHSFCGSTWRDQMVQPDFDRSNSQQPLISKGPAKTSSV
jgi:xanthine/uracil permease